MTVAKVTTVKEGSNIELQVSNLSLTQEYRIEQIGVYAYHPDTGEILYMIAQCDEGTSDVFPLPTITPITMSYNFYLVHGSAENLSITVDPAGLTKLSDFRELCDFVGYGISDYNSVYGVEIDYENRTYKRLGASVGLTSSDFDNIAPWGGRRRCNVLNNGYVVGYYGDDNYSNTGLLKKTVTIDGVLYPANTTEVQVMVEQPKFWYKTVPVKTERIAGQDGYSLCKARYYISPIPKAGFKLFPLFERGIPLREADVAYLPAYQGSIRERISITTHSRYEIVVNKLPQNKDGTIEFFFDPFNLGNGFSVDEDFTQICPIGSFTGVSISEITNELFEWFQSAQISGWSFSLNPDNNKITCTAKPLGSTVGIRVKANSSEAGITITCIEQGVGSFIRNDTTAYTMDNKPMGCTLVSVKGSKPASGLNQTLTRSNASILAKNNNYRDPTDSTIIFDEGFGWQQKDLSAYYCTAWLHLIEYGTLDCQSSVGLGVSKKWNYADYNWINDICSTGLTSDLGNASGSLDISLTDGLRSVSYRGEENAWGNISFWIEGLNIYRSNNKFSAYYSTTGIYTDNVGEEQEGYRNVGFSLSNTKGYIDRVGYSEHFDWGFLPTRTSGSNTYPVHDGFSYLTSSGSIPDGWSVAYSENGAGNSNNNGLCSLGVGRNSNSNNRYIGCSLIFVPEPKDPK